MPRYNERRETRQSRFTEDDEPRSTSRRPNSSERGSGRGRQQTKVQYCTLFALFANEHSGGRLQVDIRGFKGDEGSIEDHLSLDEFLFFCEKLYYGEVKLTGSLWECDERFASHSGNIRMSEEQLDELKDEYQESLGGRKTKKAKAEEAPAKSKRKPKYEVPEEEDEEEYEEVEEVAPKRTKKQSTPVKPALDMPTEEVTDTEETEDIPY